MIKIIYRIFVPWPREYSQRKSAAHLQQYILPLKFFIRNVISNDLFKTPVKKRKFIIL